MKIHHNVDTTMMHTRCKRAICIDILVRSCVLTRRSSVDPLDRTMSWGSWRGWGQDDRGSAAAASPGQSSSSSRWQSSSGQAAAPNPARGQAAAANPAPQDSCWVNYSLGDDGAERIATRIQNVTRPEGMPGAGWWVRRAKGPKMKNYMRAQWQKLTTEYKNCLQAKEVFDVAAYAKHFLSYEAYCEATTKDWQQRPALADAAKARGARVKRDNVPVEYLGEEEVAHCSRCLVMAHTGRAGGAYLSEQRPQRLWDITLQRLQEARQAEEDREEHERQQDAITAAACQLSMSTSTLDFSKGDIKPVLPALDHTKARAPSETAPSREALTEAVQAYVGFDSDAIVDFCKADASTFTLSQSLEQCWSAAKDLQKDQTAERIELWRTLALIFAKELCDAVLGPGQSEVRFFGSTHYLMNMHDSDVDLAAYINPQCGMEPLEFLAKVAEVVQALRRAYDNFVALRLLRQADYLGIAVWVLHSTSQTCCFILSAGMASPRDQLKQLVHGAPSPA